MKYVKFNGATFKPDPKPDPKPKKAKTKIRPVSKKREQDNKTYSTLRKVFLEGKKCVITGKEATEVHHTYSGKDRDKYFLDIKTWLPVSREGHEWIHRFPKEAREKGYLK